MSSGPFSEASCLEFLVTNQNSDGGWGFHPAAPSAVEATAWAVMAILASGPAASHEETLARARNWLLEAQRDDGSWPAYPGHPQGCWVTSVASLALFRQGGAEDAVRQGLQWVVEAWPAEGTLWRRMREKLFPAHSVRQDSSLRGWSWTPGTASWVEPTAHALLLLRAVPARTLPSGAAQRRELAERMLFDRMCPGGGWNSGNPLVYGVAGIPRTGPTAWALMALQDHAGRAEVEQSLNVLEKSVSDIKGAASLALAHRALVTYGRHSASYPSPAGHLDAHQHYFFENILTIAWIILAWREEKKNAQ
jgi:hypothetical protein